MGNSKEGSRFINPYNFVPLSGECDKQKRQAGNLTGKIECTIETLTPTFIPMREPKENGEEAPEFFHYPQDPRPVIPGSEIRGAIRSVFEAAYNGCLSQINKKAFHRRSMEPKKPGLLYKSDGKWLLVECERLSKIYHNVNTLEEGKPYQQGYLHLGEKGPDGKHIFLFRPRKNVKAYEICESTIQILENVLQLYEKNNKNNNEHSGYASYKQLFDIINKPHTDVRLPVYYSKFGDNKINHLAPASLSQEVFQNTLQDILNKQGDHAPCTCKNRLCPACHLFGFVTENELQASRIRFSDGTAGQEVSMADKITLPALGQPKSGAVEFYTEHFGINHTGNYNYWTYDYRKQGNRRLPLTPSELKIRGRKFYWHHSPEEYTLKQKVEDSMERTIKPVDKGQKFTFTVYFESVSEDEIAQLCNVLDINHSNQHAHKIGRAKPLGFGSIRIKICDIFIRKINEDTGEINMEKTSREEWRNYLIKNDELLAILNCKTFMNSGQISYPKVESNKNSENSNDSASHQWFNKNSDKKSRINNVLPTISEEVSSNQHKWLKVKKV